MAQGSRPERIGEEIRQAVSVALARDVQDPRIGFVTVTRVKVSADLQQARVYYTAIGDDKARRDTARGLEAAKPFLRRAVGGAVRLRRVPELAFEYDRGVEHQDRVEQILHELAEERRARGPVDDDGTEGSGGSEGGAARTRRQKQSPPRSVSASRSSSPLTHGPTATRSARRWPCRWRWTRSGSALGWS
jgi:ribosome-binding factor A